MRTQSEPITAFCKEHMKRIGKRLAALRSKTGLCRYDVAMRTGLLYGSMQAYEQGRSCPSVTELSILCALYDGDPRWVLWGDGDKDLEKVKSAEVIVVKVGGFQ